ncbi:cytochrome P450, partial [Streptomyces sp. SID11233]|nr:cytochrome P450 [Streptomyces sp. SID11233]
AAASTALTDYLEALLAEKQTHPEDDLLSDLATRQVVTGQLSRRDAARTGVLLLAAGHETTANMIELGTLALLRN